MENLHGKKKLSTNRVASRLNCCYSKLLRPWISIYFLLAVAFATALCTNVSATPYSYTIEGRVINGPGIVDTAGYLSQMGITVGSTVSYTFTVDFNISGTFQTADGSIYQYSDSVGRPTFFAQYNTGSTISTDNHLPTYNGLTSNNYGGADMIVNGQLQEFWLNISNGNNALLFQDILMPINSSGRWSTNGNVFGCASMRNTIFNQDGSYSTFYFDDARIINVEPAPVPEPSTMLLLCCGLIGVILYKCRIINNCPMIRS